MQAREAYGGSSPAEPRQQEKAGYFPVTRFDQIEYACLTDVGVRRSHNQDDHAVQLAFDEGQWRERGHLFLVADGMGAHAVGEKASEQAVGLIPHTYHLYAKEGPAPALRKAFVEANASIHACGQANPEFEGMGTTSTALLVRPEGAWVGHVGDSRVYRIRGQVIEQLSYDHSLIWEYARLQRLDPEEVQDIPSNVIHRCLGPEALVQPDVEGPHQIQPGDIFLLCSDGLSGQVSDPEMGAVARSLPPAEACRFLVDLANLRGGPDNITVLIARIGESATKESPSPPPEIKENHPRRSMSVPWWLIALLAGTVLSLGAAGLQMFDFPTGALLVFLLAVVSILAGLAGLLVQFQREKNQPATEEQTTARIHRKSHCRIDKALVDKLSKAVESLRQVADERKWEPDWDLHQKHRTQAEEFLAKKDLPSAFRSYCRAMIPLTQALHKNRHKEEVFQPVWDKSR